MTKEKIKKYSTSERVTLAIFGVSVGLYFLNILLGKASVQWGWKVFYLGDVSEFLLLLIASISFVVAALHREASRDQNNKEQS